MISRVPKATDRATRRMPWRLSAPRAACAASSRSARIWRDRSRNTAPASVVVTRLVVRRNSLTPSRASRLATIRETEGCEIPSSRETREKLPVSAARTKTDSSRS